PMSALIFLSSISAFAAPAEKYVCTEYNRSNNALKQNTVVLTPVQKGSIKENIPFGYRLEVYQGAKVVSELEVIGTVLTEDVSFEFTSVDKKVSFYIFLDEMNESGLKISGRKAGDYICR
ncbi:MAG: hypothetical protein K2X47_10300, partial [Bdellovibrionales bacterium]|nr:hypothetical protein [Bdellovibrionales bacterium]